jgi:hypothetical protein
LGDGGAVGDEAAKRGDLGRPGHFRAPMCFLPGIDRTQPVAKPSLLVTDVRFTDGLDDFGRAAFTGGEVHFAEAGTWSHPPLFDWNGKLPAG